MRNASQVRFGLSVLGALALGGLAFSLREAGMPSGRGDPAPSAIAARVNESVDETASEQIAETERELAAGLPATSSIDRPAGRADAGHVVPDQWEREAGQEAAKAIEQNSWHPFQISTSISASCADLDELANGSCRDLYAAIDLMDSESRDELWASRSEEALTGLLDARPGFLVRSVRCQRTICALETESAIGVLRVRSSDLPADLIELDRNFGYESEGGVVRRTVTLSVFERLGVQ